MKNLLIFILILVVVAMAGVVTCPDKDAHQEALKGVITEAVYEKFFGDGPELNLFGTSLISGVSNFVLSNTLRVENYFVCSVGVFNHVFIPGKEQFKAMLSNQL